MSTVNARRSNWWFLLPIFLHIVGGLIAYFVIRCDDQAKARNCLYLGIVLFVVQICIFGVADSLLFGAIGWNMFGPGF